MKPDFFAEIELSETPYWVTVGDALSALVGRIILYTDNANESISMAAYRKQDWVYGFVNGFFFWQENHCRDAYWRDLIRASDLLEECGFTVSGGCEHLQRGDST